MKKKIMSKLFVTLIITLMIIGGFGNLIPAEIIDNDIKDQYCENIQTPYGIYDNTIVLAQSFVPTLNTLTRIKIYCSRDQYTLSGYIVTSISDSLDGDALAASMLLANQITESGQWRTVMDLSSTPLSLTPGVTYYIKLYLTNYQGPNHNFYWWRSTQNSYPNGNRWVKQSGQWTPDYSSDFCFQTWGYNKHTITFHTDPSYGGYITFGGSNYYDGDNIRIRDGSYSIQAHPGTNYGFQHWSKTGGLTIDNEYIPSTTVTMSGDCTLTVHFYYIPPPPRVWFYTSPSNGGRIIFDGDYYENNDVILTTTGSHLISADPYQDYTFNRWEYEPDVSVDHPYNQDAYAIVEGDGSLTAVFDLQPPPNNPPTPPTGLTCDGLTNPDQVTNPTPAFSAIYNDPDTNDIATMLRIEVGDDSNWGDGAEMWASEIGCSVQRGDRCSDITYHGVSLQAGTNYFWRVRYFDGEEWGDWSDTATFRTFLLDITIDNPTRSHKFNDAFFPGIDWWLLPFPENENQWFIDHGYGNKMNLAEKYARSGVFADCSGPPFLYFVVQSLIGCTIDVPVITQEGAIHGAWISIEGNYHGFLQVKTLAAARMDVKLYIEDDNSPQLPYSQPIKYEYLAHHEIILGLTDQQQPISGSFTHDNTKVFVLLEEGKQYRIMLDASASTVVAGYDTFIEGVYVTFSGEGLSDSKVNWGSIKVDWHNPPVSPPMDQHNPSIQTVSSNTDQVQINEPITFTANATDDNNDLIYYKWYWDDGTTSNWLGPYTQGQPTQTTHAFNQPGAYFVRVQSKEYTQYNLTSPLSERIQINVTIPQGSITIISPSPGEQWTGDIEKTIRWNYQGSVGNEAVIDLYKKQGNNYIFQEKITPDPIPVDSYEYTWIVDPNIDTGSYTIILKTIANVSSSGDITITHNTKPTKPSTPAGPSIVFKGNTYTYSTSAHDPDGDNIRYGWDWNGDDSIDEWTNYKASDAIAYTNHTFSQSGTYSIQVIANDTHGALSEWSDHKSIIVPTDNPTCFLSGTQITMFDGSRKNIEDIKVGDLVKSFDTSNRITAGGFVTKVYHHTAEEMSEYYLIINKAIRVTPTHLLFVNGEWIPAGSVQVGDHLLRSNGAQIPITSIEKVYNQVATYNFDILPLGMQANQQNYFVEGYLVNTQKQSVQVYIEESQQQSQQSPD
ncbi:MAG: PKD domain-containing protein [Methanobacteriota archaeon]